MKPIFNIARAELRHHFFSPVAWFVLILFFAMSALYVLTTLENLAVLQQAGKELEGDKFQGFLNSPLTVLLSATYIDNVSQLLFLVIPLLTMGAINREYAAGTIRLIHSSPVSTRQFVLGKFLGIYAFMVLIILIYSLMLVVLSFSIKNAEIIQLFTVVLGLLFISAFFVSIGLFISSLTRYPIVAAIGTFVGIVFFSTIGGMFQQYDHIRDITYFLSNSNRAKRIILGLLNTRDLVYLLIMPAMFIVFTIIKAKSVTESKSWKVPAMRYTAVLSITVLVLMATSIPGYIGYWDITRVKRNTIHEKTQEVISKLDGSPLTVTLYTNLLGKKVEKGLPVNRNNYKWDYWNQFLRFYPNIKFQYVYYYDVKDEDSLFLRRFPNKTMDEVAEKFAEINKVDLADFMPPAAIRKHTDFGSEDLGLNMKLEYNGKSTWLRCYDDLIVFPHEHHVSGSLLRLITDTTPTFKFLKGHLERDPYKLGSREYGVTTTSKKTRLSLINTGIDVDTIQSVEPSSFKPHETLVIADPKTVLETSIIDSVKNYLDQGGNAIFFAETGKQFVMNPILNHIGVNADNGVIVRANKHEMPHVLIPKVTVKGAELSDELPLFWFRNKVKDTCIVGATGAANLSYTNDKGFQIENILKVNNEAKTWIENGHLVVDSAAPVFQPEQGDIMLDKPYAIALQLTRKINNKEQRIIVCGDADVMQNAGQGGELGLSFYAFTTQNTRPVYANKQVPIDIFLLTGKQSAKIIKTTFVYIVPALILVAGIIVLIRRKRK